MKMRLQKEKGKVFLCYCATKIVKYISKRMLKYDKMLNGVISGDIGCNFDSSNYLK